MLWTSKLFSFVFSEQWNWTLHTGHQYMCPNKIDCSFCLRCITSYMTIIPSLHRKRFVQCSSRMSPWMFREMIPLCAIKTILQTFQRIHYPIHRNLSLVLAPKHPQSSQKSLKLLIDKVEHIRLTSLILWHIVRTQSKRGIIADWLTYPPSLLIVREIVCSMGGIRNWQKLTTCSICNSIVVIGSV